jgi:uncharacterized membrane protein
MEEKKMIRRRPKLTPGQRVADTITNAMGSWTFIITQTVLIIIWIIFNLTAWINHWDPYPFILLNLLFSTQAAYAAPIIMMAQNRQAQRDRIQARYDLATDRAAKREIEDLQRSLTRIELEKLDKILEMLENKKS